MVPFRVFRLFAFGIGVSTITFNPRLEEKGVRGKTPQKIDL